MKSIAKFSISRNGEVKPIMDLTQTTATAKDVWKGVKFHNQDGKATDGSFQETLLSEIIQGTIVKLVDDDMIEKVGPYALSMCTKLEILVLPVCKEIGDYGLAYCESLGSNPAQPVLDASSLTKIGNYACQGCNSLKSVKMEINLFNLGEGTFQGCQSLTTISPDPEVWSDVILLQQVMIVPKYCFDYCTAITYVDGPKITTLEAGAFSQCTSLKKANMPELMYINDGPYYEETNMVYGGFSECFELEEIFPEVSNRGDYGKLYDIGDYAFILDPKLVYRDLGSAKTIGVYAFYGCTKLDFIYNIYEEDTKQYFPTNTFYNAIDIDHYAFSHCENFAQDVIIDDGYNTITTRNPSIYMPQIEHIGGFAFEGVFE